MNSINLVSYTGDFAENKDIARNLRIEQITPSLEKDESVILDFEGVQAVTQSFIHALLSDILRNYGSNALNIIKFKNCNENIKEIITIVTDYMQESL